MKKKFFSKNKYLTEEMKKNIILIINNYCNERNISGFWYGKSLIIINFIDKYKKEIKNNEDIKTFILNNINIENIENMYKNKEISASLKNEIQDYLYSIPMFNEITVSEEGKEKYNYVKNLTEEVINKLKY